jgi:hypothetical protein
MNISVAAANDYDRDGDLDLFVGARSVPFSYGVPPRSYLYQNDGRGHFSELPSMPFSEIGMVSAALWSDVSGDGREELIITGAWMPTRIFSYDGKAFVEIKETGLEHLSGWWQSLAVADLNADGRMDLVIGNIGENFYLHPDARSPVRLWVNDFDQNGTTDPFLTRVVEGRDVPVFLKREITDQFPALKKDNLKHRDYAKKSLQELFSNDMVRGSHVLEFNYCASIVALNNGKGKFSLQALPSRVQLSSVNAICIMDVNNDVKPDLVLGGNMFDFPPQFGRLDASYGNILINNGKGGFDLLEPVRSGLKLTGAVKDICEIRSKNKRCLLVALNDKSPLMYKLSK